MRRKPSASLKGTDACDGVIRAAIGRMLAAQYDLAAPLPARLEHLMRRLEDESGAAQPRRDSSPRAA